MSWKCAKGCRFSCRSKDGKAATTRMHWACSHPKLLVVCLQKADGKYVSQQNGRLEETKIVVISIASLYETFKLKFSFTKQFSTLNLDVSYQCAKIIKTNGALELVMGRCTQVRMLPEHIVAKCCFFCTFAAGRRGILQYSEARAFLTKTNKVKWIPLNPKHCTFKCLMIQNYIFLLIHTEIVVCLVAVLCLKIKNSAWV